MPMQVDEAMREDLRRFNRKLAHAPRFRYRNRLLPTLGQGLLLLSQLGADRRLRRSGLDVERHTVREDGLRVGLRILRPPGTLRGLVLDIHGGGWVIGNAAMNDAFNGPIARECGVAVVSVDYGLAPRTPIGTMMDQCLLAARWLLEDGLPGTARLPAFVIGESAGGQLAAATLLRLKSRPALFARIAGAVLYYGVYDMAGSDSVRRAGPGTLVLDGPAMLPALRLLTPGLDEQARRQAPLSPLYADLAGMPPALMYTGERDPLRDDTLLMAQRWAAHAPVELNDLPDAPHGLIHFPVAMGRAACAHTRGWLAERLAQAGAPVLG
jgi:acetyl esterase/lipase